VRLPANAYAVSRPAKCVPIVGAAGSPPQATWRSVSRGLLLIVFTVASASPG
jgi:hypothetical protein